MLAGMDTMEGPQWFCVWLVMTNDLEKAAFVGCLGRPLWSLEWGLGAVLNSCPREGVFLLGWRIPIP